MNIVEALQHPELAKGFFRSKTGALVLNRWPECRLAVKAVPILQSTQWRMRMYWGSKMLYQGTVSRCFPKDKDDFVKVVHTHGTVLGAQGHA